MATTFHHQYQCWVAAMTHTERTALLKAYRHWSESSASTTAEPGTTK
jgi:hypothetical protein